MSSEKFSYFIRKAGKEDWDDAMAVAWKTFLKFEADVYTKEGVRSFFDFITDSFLYRMFLNGAYHMFIAEDDGKIIGIITLRNDTHISLLFVDEDYHRQGVGSCLMRTLWDFVKTELGKEVDGPEAEKLYREQLNESAVLIDGALEILEYLSRKYDLYVITNGVSKTQYNRLAKSGIDRYMKDIFVSEDAGCQKPRKEFFEYCFKRLGTDDVSQMLVIGDSLSSDIRGGNNAGIDTCWFNRKGDSCPADISVDYEIRHLEELKKYL